MIVYDSILIRLHTASWDFGKTKLLPNNRHTESQARGAATMKVQMSGLKPVLRAGLPLLIFMIMLLPTTVPAAAASSPLNSAMAPAGASGGDKLVQFTSGGHVLGFSSDSVFIASSDHMLKTEFIGSNAITPEIEAEAPAENSAGTASPLGKVTYNNVWDDVTLVYEASPGAILKSSYYINATEKGVPVERILLDYNHPLSIDENGNLVIAYETGTMVQSAPVAWQEIDGQIQPVTAAFVLYGEREVGFSLGDYDADNTVVLGGELVWNTFLGGSGDDSGNAIAVDSSGNVYVAGSSTANWGSPVQAYTWMADGFAAKLDSSGNLVWNSFLGGFGNDTCRGIAVDSSGNVYVTGYSNQTWGIPKLPFSDNTDAFAAKLDSSGNVAWNTFLGGIYYDYGFAIALDGSSNVYVAGYSYAGGWGSPVRAYMGNSDAFAVKLDSSGNYIWHTFLGGSGLDYGRGIVADGAVYVSGESNATWGSPVRAFTAGNYDAFAARLDSSGNLLWNTFLGGNGYDYGEAIALDGSGNVYVGGTSNATWGAPLIPYVAGGDAFAARLDSSGNMAWNTFLGGSGGDAGYAIAVDGSSNVYVGGASVDTWGAPLIPYTAGNYDAFAAGLDSSGHLAWNTFLGGTGDDEGFGIAANGDRSVYVTGWSDDTWGSPLRAYSAAPYDAFAAKLTGTTVTTEEAALEVPSKRLVSPQMPSYQPPPADIYLHNVSVSPDHTVAGQPVIVLANLVNKSVTGGSYDVILRINGKVEQQRTVEVSPGTAYPVRFTVTKSQPGTYNVAIENQKTSFTVLGGDTSSAPVSGGLIALIVIVALILGTAVVLMISFRRHA
jgi:hypothetical protein